MNIQCPVCQDVVPLNSKISALRCGHCFHGACLERSLKFKRQCPCCREGAPAGSIISQLYFDCTDQPAKVFDAVELQAKIEQLQNDKDSLESRLAVAVADKMDAEKQLRKFKDHNRGMKAQVETFKAVQDRCNEYEKRVEDMKRRLDLLTNVETMLNGSLKMDQNGDLRNLSSTDLRAMVGVLRRQLSRSTQQKDAAMQDKHKIDVEVRRLQRELNEARKARERDRESMDSMRRRMSNECSQLPTAADAVSIPFTAKSSPALLPLLPPPSSRVRDESTGAEWDTLSPLNIPGGARTVNLLKNSLKGRWDGLGSRTNSGLTMLRPLDSNVSKNAVGPAAKRKKFAVKSKSFDFATGSKGQAKLDAFVASASSAEDTIPFIDDDDDVIVL